MESKKDGIRRLPLSKDLFEEIVNGSTIAGAGSSDTKSHGRSATSEITAAAADSKDSPSRVIQHHRDSINHKLDAADDKSAPHSESLEELHNLQISSSPSISEPFISESKAAQQIMGGFTIVSMNMRDASSGKLIWHSGDWTNVDMFEEEIKADVPKSILNCRAVSREIVFRSREEMGNFHLKQHVYFHGTCIEQWFFHFGFVMRGSENTWQQTIEAAPPAEMLPSDVLSGHVIFETSFFNDDQLLGKTSVRIYYV